MFEKGMRRAKRTDIKWEREREGALREEVGVGETGSTGSSEIGSSEPRVQQRSPLISQCTGIL